MERDVEFPESMVYSLICISEESTVKELSHETGERYMVTVHRAPHKWKGIVWWGTAGFPKGIVCDTGITTPVPCSLPHNTFHFGLGRLLVLHTCYYLLRDPGYGTPHNPEVQTRVWIYRRFVQQLPYLVLWQGAHWTRSVVVTVLHNEDRVRTTAWGNLTGLWRTLGGCEECIQKFVGEPLGKWPLGRPRGLWEDDVNIIKEKHCEIGNWL